MVRLPGGVPQQSQLDAGVFLNSCWSSVHTERQKKLGSDVGGLVTAVRALAAGAGLENWVDGLGN